MNNQYEQLLNECINATIKDEFSGVFDLFDKYDNLHSPCLKISKNNPCSSCISKYSKCVPIMFFVYNIICTNDNVNEKIKGKASKKLNELIAKLKTDSL